jgi:hypothetical protein
MAGNKHQLVATLPSYIKPESLRETASISAHNMKETNTSKNLTNITIREIEKQHITYPSSK